MPPEIMESIVSHLVMYGCVILGGFLGVFCAYVARNGFSVIWEDMKDLWMDILDWFVDIGYWFKDRWDDLRQRYEYYLRLKASKH